MMHEETLTCYSCVQLGWDSDAVRVFAVSPVSDSSEAERRQDGSRILSAELLWVPLKTDQRLISSSAHCGLTIR
jgi:hypothetical protein